MIAQYISEISLSAVLFAALVCVGAIAFYSIHKAQGNLALEYNMLACLKDKMNKLMEAVRKERYKEDDIPVKDAYTAAILHAKEYGVESLSSSAAVQRYLYASHLSRPEEEEEKSLHTSYASDRLYALLCSVSTENLVRKTPPLADLTELTMQRERGGTATATLRTLAPTILVLGILGTLLGVHERVGVLGNMQSGGVEYLADALIPGALAVLVTVVLMIWRELGYNRNLAKFCSEFDEYTLKELVPFFRPLSQQAADIQKLVSSMKNAASAIVCLGQLSNELNECCNLISTYETSNSKSLLPQAGKLLQQMYVVCHVGAKMLKDSDDVQQNIAARLEPLAYGKKALQKCLVATNKGVKNSRTALEHVYDNVGEPVLAEYETLATAAAMCVNFSSIGTVFQELRMKQYDMPSLNQSLSHLQTVHLRLLSLNALFEEYRSAADDVKNADKRIDEDVEEMQKCSQGLPILLDKQRECYSTLTQDSGVLKQQLLDCISEILLPKLRELKTRINTFQKKRQPIEGPAPSPFKVFILVMTGRGTSHYPPGMKGVQLYMKDRFIKLRHNRRTKVWIAIAYAATLLWSIIIIIL